MSVELSPGAAIGEYRITQRVGSFATGTVYRASQPALGRDVLLHVASPTPRSVEAQQFLAHARALAAVSHPSVPEVYETGIADGVFFASMRNAPGRPLAEIADEGPIAPERAVALVEQIVGAIEALRLAGDQARLAPESVLLRDSEANLLPLAWLRGKDPNPRPFRSPLCSDPLSVIAQGRSRICCVRPLVSHQARSSRRQRARRSLRRRRQPPRAGEPWLLRSASSDCSLPPRSSR